MRAKKLLSDLEAGGEHARLKVEANRTGAELLQLEAFVNANFKSAPPPARARHAYANTRKHTRAGLQRKAQSCPDLAECVANTRRRFHEDHQEARRCVGAEVPCALRAEAQGPALL